MSRRGGLGRGLDALLPTDEKIEERGQGLSEIPVEAIEPNPNQPRSAFDEATLADLAASITQLGILQPMLVRAVGPGRFELIAGERRLRAAQQAGLDRVPVVIVDTDERGSLERAIVENIHREDLNPIEEAAAYKQLIDEAQLTQEELGQRLSRNRVTINTSLRLLDLPLVVQRLLQERKLTAGHGRVLIGLMGNPFLERLAQRAANERLSVRETEDLVRKYHAMSGVAPRSAQTTGPPAIATEIQHRLADHLQTRVRIDMGKRKGKIVIDFVSLDELQRVGEAMLGVEPTTVERVTPE